jgi:hypothetical protein
MNEHLRPRPRPTFLSLPIFRFNDGGVGLFTLPSPPSAAAADRHFFLPVDEEFADKTSNNAIWSVLAGWLDGGRHCLFKVMEDRSSLK